MNDNMQNGSRSCDDVEHNLKNQLSFDSTSTFSCNIGDSFSEFGEEQDRKGARFNLQLNTVRRISTQSEIESRIAAQAGIAALRLDESIPEEMMTNETLNDSNEIVHCDGDLAPVTIKNLSDVSIGELEAIAGSSSTISMMENLPPIDAKDINQNKSFRQGSISLVRRGMTAEFVAKTETNDSNMSNPLSARTALSSVSLTKTKNGKNFVADKDPSDALRTYKVSDDLLLLD